MTEQVFKVPATHIYWVHKYNLHRISLESANLTLCLVNGQRLYQLTSKKCWHSESWPSRKLFFLRSVASWLHLRPHEVSESGVPLRSSWPTRHSFRMNQLFAACFFWHFSGHACFRDRFSPGQKLRVIDDFSIAWLTPRIEKNRRDYREKSRRDYIEKSR